MKTHRTLSKAWALCLAVLMVMGLFGTTALAIDQNTTGAITVSAEEDNLNVSAYQLMSVNISGNGQPQEPVYTWATSVAGWVRSNYPAYIGSGSDNSVQDDFNREDVNDTSGGSKTFYDALAAAIKGGTLSSLQATQTAQTSDGTATLSALPMGNYLILIEGGMKIYSPSAVNLVPTWDTNNSQWVLNTATVVPKSSEPTITKTVKAEDTTGDGKEADNASIGDVVTFDIVADVPQFPASALAKNYAISDTLPDGMSLTAGSIQVSGVNGVSETPLAQNTDYTHSGQRPTGVGGQTTTFTLTFGDYSRISSYEKIHVTYTATLDSDAVLGATGNQNEAYLDYSNNPYDASSWSSKSDIATVYTYGLYISKVDEADQTPLAGAQFELYASQEDAANREHPISFIGAAGEYRKALTNEEGSVTTLTVDPNEGETKGTLTLKGLDAGIWYLVETVAPGGYNRLGAPVSVTITDGDTLDGTVTPAKGADGEDAALRPLTVENNDGFQLPVTGGIGTILFTAVGVVLMGAAVVLFVILLRRKRVDN